MKVLTYGGEKNFNDLKPLSEIYQRCHLTSSQILKDLLQIIH